jgi:hypothetical protein
VIFDRDLITDVKHTGRVKQPHRCRLNLDPEVFLMVTFVENNVVRGSFGHWQVN